MRHLWLPALLAIVALTGCNDSTAPRDTTPPAAPRGLYGVTGDQTVTLYWLANTESDVAGYRIYMADCPDGQSCPYSRVGTTGLTSFAVTGLTNGQTHYFGVSAVDHAGNESELSPDYWFDTPRPAGTGLMLTDAMTTPATAGYDFSSYVVRPFDDPSTDIYFQISAGGVAQMVCPFTDTDIQDAGYATTLDAVDYAPTLGWSATGTVELIPGHCYVLRIGSTVVNYAKFRVTASTASNVVMDWAYQTDPGNRELRARPAGNPAPRQRRTFANLQGHEAAHGK
jgi:hypothetical protein